MNTTKSTVKAHIAAGLDINSPVIWINHLGQPVQGTLAKEGKFWCVRDVDGKCLQNGGAGAKFIFSY